MAGTDFSHLTNDELIKGIKALDLPDYIRSKAYGVDVRETLAQMTEMTIQLCVNMGLPPDEALKWARKLQESVSQSEFDSWVATLLDGGPSIFMNTLSELQTTYPNGAPGVALVRETDPAKIYVWNGSSWEDFGDYQGIEIKDGAVTNEKLQNNSVTFNKINPNNTNSNILNNSALTNRYYGGSVGSQATLNGSSNWSGIQDPIPVEDGDIVRFNKAFQELYFVGVDESNIIRQLGGTMATAGYKEIVVGSNVVGFYTAVHSSVLDSAMITINTKMPSTYMPYSENKLNLSWLHVSRENLDDSIIDELNNNQSSHYAGKTMITAGDSITWQDSKVYSGTSNIARGWQTVVRENLSLASVKNIAVSGRSMADGTSNGAGTVTTVLSETEFTEDLFVIAAGTNDFKLNVPIGNLDNVGGAFDRNTFYGAYQTTLEYILSKRKDIRIVLFTPLHRTQSGYNSTTFENAAGHKLIDYVNAIKEVGARYSVPVCDMYANSGINMLTVGVDTRDGLHPSDLGYIKMGNYASKFINNI